MNKEENEKRENVKIIEALSERFFFVCLFDYILLKVCARVFFPAR